MSLTTVPRLPKPPQKPYIRPDKRESKAMTIVAGFRCADGIVLCADQQVSAVGSHKYFETKIVARDGFIESIAFAYSGLPSLAHEAREKMMKILKEVNLSNDAVYEAADQVLTNMGRQYADVELQLLIGVVVMSEEPALIKFDGKGLHMADNISFLGIGDSSLVRFLADTMSSSTMTIKEAVDLGIYIVQKAEQYVDHCGGPIDVLTLNESCACTLLSEMEIQAKIKQMEAQEVYLGDLIFRRPPFSS
jgi:20S proteasome alpha/beta subunit